jgi:hypothetical protein
MYSLNKSSCVIQSTTRISSEFFFTCYEQRESLKTKHYFKLIFGNLLLNITRGVAPMVQQNLLILLSDVAE